jgi:hydroxymethylbilane synthase
MLTLEALVGRVDGSQLIRDRVEGEASRAEALGVALAERLITRGADQILRDCVSAQPVGGS